MSQLFSPEWTQELATLWNKDLQMREDLGSIEFSACVGFGMISEQTPRVAMHIEDGIVHQVEVFQRQALDWDVRADEDDWRDWLEHGFGLERLGVMTSSGRLQFMQGEHRKMLRNQAMARSFLRVFELMARVKTTDP